jgi:phenylalanyl-tRNA synthetase alpha subunit
VAKKKVVIEEEDLVEEEMDEVEEVAPKKKGKKKKAVEEEVAPKKKGKKKKDVEEVDEEVQEVADGPVYTALAQMSQVVADLEKGCRRIDRGIAVKAEGTRVRKQMQIIKSIASEIRNIIGEIKANHVPDPERSAKAKNRDNPFWLKSKTAKGKKKK